MMGPNFKILGKTGLSVSDIGFGTYRVDLDHPEHREALKKALSLGCNLIDTSTNYTDGESETLIGEVLAELISEGKITRNEITLVTKVGYLQGQNLEQAKSRENSGHPFSEVVKYGEGIWHCISPDFLAHQIEESLKRLKVSKIDALLLHNPEYFLKNGGTHEEYYQRISKAFAHLEKECAQNRISYYGVSSNTFPDPKTSPEFTSLEILWDLAASLTKDPHFSVIQLPLNLLEPGAALEINNQQMSVLEFAREKNLGVLINRPLNAFHGQSLIRLADFKHSHEDSETQLQNSFTEILGIEAQYRFQKLLPFSEIAWGHILQKNFSKVAEIDGFKQILAYQIEPALKLAQKTFAKDPEASLWMEAYLPVARLLFSRILAYLEEQAARISRKLGLQLDFECPELKKVSELSNKVISVYQSLPGVSSVLVGMRKPEYVESLLAQKSRITLTPTLACALLAEAREI